MIIHPKELHAEAMELSFQASLIEQDSGEPVSIKKVELYKKAFELEKSAAMLMRDRTDCEPTRSILFKSAAWLAIKSGDNVAAVLMAEEGLKHTIHNEIKKELYEVLDKAKASC